MVSDFKVHHIHFQNLVSSLSYDCPLLLTTLTALGEIALLAPTLFETQRPAIVRDFVVKELLMKDRVSQHINIDVFLRK